MPESMVVAGFNLADLFERVADAVPERVALVAGDDRRTYRELDDRATRLAHELPRGHIGLCLSNSIAHVELMLACYKRGAVPINVNWRYTPAEIAYVAADADLGAAAGTTQTTTKRSSTRGSPARVTSGNVRATTTTCSTPAAPPACRRASCGATKTSSSARSAAGTPAGPPITDPDADRACRSSTIRRNGCARSSRPMTPGPMQFVTLGLGPLVHASGQWSALGALLGGGKVVLFPHRSLDFATRARSRRTRTGRTT